MTPPTPLQVLTTAVDSYTPYLQPSGELIDPFFAEPTQYGTPYHALCQAVLAARGEAVARSWRMDNAARGLDASLRHVSDPSLAPTASTMRRTTGAVRRINHRDFFWPPILKTYRILLDEGHERSAEFARRIAAVEILDAFASRPPSNWAMVWLSGEWLRIREGLSSHTLDDFDRWLAPFFASHILVDMGLYQEPGHPNSYDLFTRYHLADILANGYNGRWRSVMEELMVTGLRRSLAVQLSDGSLASAYRSTGQTWTLGTQCAYFTLAANFLAGRDGALSEQARQAARRAFASFLRWQRPDGPYSPVENLLPPAYRVGYESYTADGHYANLAMGFLAVAILNGFDAAPLAPEEADRAPTALIEGDPTYRAIAHAGPYSAHLNAFPSPRYDGFGLVDVTFGVGRRLHFVSSVQHLAEPGFYNLGLAVRQEPGRSELRVLAQEDPRPIGPIEPGSTTASFQVQARVKGSPYPYTLALQVDAGEGVQVEEATPGLVGYKTLLVPYLRDGGWEETTQVELQVAERHATLAFRLGEEVVTVEVDGAVDHILHFPYGYESRRGLCGLLRVDLADPCEGIRYQLRRIS